MQPESVDHLDLELVEFGTVCGVGDALVHDEPRMHVGQVVAGDQCRHVQVDFVARRQGRIEVGGLAGLDGGDRPFEHLHVEREADVGDLPRLFVAEEFAGAADL